VNKDPANLLAGGIFACEFAANTANGPAGVEGLGGAIYHREDLHIFNSVFVDNQSVNSGGGAIGNGQVFTGRELLVSNSTFTGNSAATDGGALSAPNSNAVTTVIQSTFADNSAVGVGREAFSAGTVTWRNSIVANTSSGTNCDDAGGGGTFTDSGGNVQFEPGNSASCGLAAGGDPQLQALAVDGPLPVRTLPLGAASSALGIGAPATCSTFPVLSLDARGQLRPTMCDAGAHEADGARLVINEVDYQQPGTDDSEFVEIFNSGSGAADLGAARLELVDGVGGGAVVTSTISLPSVQLGAGEFFVVCSQVGIDIPSINCNLDTTPDFDLLGDGDPDAVGLRFSGVLLDAVSWGGDTGAPYTEGSGAGALDSPSDDFFSMSRTSDGVDNNDNSADFAGRCHSPGLPNAGNTMMCNIVPVELMSFSVE
jgi:predicted outer membrane repeat protein